MRHRMGHIQKKRSICVLVDELHRPAGQLSSDLILIIEGLDDSIDLVLFVPGQGRPSLG